MVFIINSDDGDAGGNFNVENETEDDEFDNSKVNIDITENSKKYCEDANEIGDGIGQLWHQYNEYEEGNTNDTNVNIDLKYMIMQMEMAIKYSMLNMNINVDIIMNMKRLMK